MANTSRIPFTIHNSPSESLTFFFTVSLEQTKNYLPGLIKDGVQVTIGTDSGGRLVVDT